MMNSSKTMIRIEGISKSFVTTKAVCGACLSIERGEIRGLVGENGSGKSTLVSIIAGILKPDEGTMILQGKDYKPQNLLNANNEKVSIIVQEMGTIKGLSVAANLFLGKEKRFKRFGFLNFAKVNQEARDLLNKYGEYDIEPDSDISSLSFEERKLVEFEKALYSDPDLLIVDETTTALSQDGREILFREMEKLRQQNKTVIFISHDLGEVIKCCDRITVMKDGRIVDTVLTSEIDENALKELMVGRELEHHYYREDLKASYKNTIVLRVRNLELEGTFRGISFDLHEGEILGIGGLTNCGMHQLGKALFGMTNFHAGSIELPQKSKRLKEQMDFISSGIGYLPKNRDQEGLMLFSSIKDNICLASIDKLGRKFFIPTKEEMRVAEKGAKQLNLKMSSIDQLCIYLSGGNKQKVSIAKWLARDSDILILDCPTRGIDVSVKASIYGLMQQLKAEGKAIIMISEELPELIGMSDRIIILKNGEIQVISGRKENLSEEELIHYMI
jgi:ribose transport system ATP-binding protein